MPTWMPLESEDSWKCLAERGTPGEGDSCFRNAGHLGKHMDCDPNRTHPDNRNRMAVTATWTGGRGEVCRRCGGHQHLQARFSNDPAQPCPACNPDGRPVHVTLTGVKIPIGA
jgi:hypothetical protein